MTQASAQYAAIDLGSNSFHLLVAQKQSGSVKPLICLKRKVRLASGLNSDNILSDEAMARGWHTLRLFAEQLSGISRDNIRVVATATLRLARNADEFTREAEQILGVPISIIDGKQEAELIYQGVAQTTGGPSRRLVIDIGGASTEFITGTGAKASTLNSLSMGCVTWLERYFSDNQLNHANFLAAENAAKEVISPIVAQLKQHPWAICVGASGTIQALQEILLENGLDENITKERLLMLRQKAIECGEIKQLSISGLTEERSLVFPSGLAILLAIFDLLDIDSMTLAGGALREGLVYSMLGMSVNDDIRLRTLQYLTQSYHLDHCHIQRVINMASLLAKDPIKQGDLSPRCIDMLQSSINLHEIGLSVNIRNNTEHAAYLLQYLPLPGFSDAQRKLLIALVKNQQGAIDSPMFNLQNAVSLQQAQCLCRLLRLSLILCISRCDDDIPGVSLRSEADEFTLTLPNHWLDTHPLQEEMLQQEIIWQGAMGCKLILA